MAAVRFIAGAFLALLPANWRRRLLPEIDLVHSAIVSSIVLIVGCLAALIVRYIFFIQARVAVMGADVIQRGLEGALVDRRVGFAMGTIALVEFLVQPLTLLLIYFAIESAGRLTAAFTTQEVVPSLPLQLIEWARQKIARDRHRRELGPLILDRVEAGPPGEFDVRIASCRRKPNWNHLMTVSYAGELYEVIREEQAARPRPWVYLLRKKPPEKVVRGLHHYAPDEVLAWEE